MDIKTEIKKNIEIEFTKVFSNKPKLLATFNLTLKTKYFGTIELRSLSLLKSPKRNNRLNNEFLYATTPYNSYHSVGMQKRKISYFKFEPHIWEVLEPLIYKAFLERKEVMPIDESEMDIDDIELSKIVEEISNT